MGDQGRGAVDRLTRTPPYRLLLVVRNGATLDRLLSLLQVLRGDVPEIRFTIEPGSVFDHGLSRHVESRGYQVLTWQEATASSFDVILAAQASWQLAGLRGYLVVCPHGAGYNRLVPGSTGCDTVATGLVRSQLMHDGEVIPDLIYVSHAEQIGRLRESVPEAAERAVVLGDPVFDRIADSEVLRSRFRRKLGVAEGQKLVVVSSTWGRHGTLGTREDLIPKLLAQLPVHEYRLLVILHPNVWAGHSAGEVKLYLQDYCDSGLLYIPPNTPWEAGVIAGDILLGDHGSVTYYGAALGRPYLLVADGRAELDPVSPPALLSGESDYLDLEQDLLPQIERNLDPPEPAEVTAVAGAMFQERDRSWEILRNGILRAAGRPVPERAPRTIPVDDPEAPPGRRLTAWMVLAEVTDPGSGPMVAVRCFPRIAVERVVDFPEDYLMVAAEAEPDRLFRENSEIIVHVDPVDPPIGEEWTKSIFARYPGVGLVGYAFPEGSELRWRDGATVRVDHPDVVLAAAVVHCWRANGYPVDVTASVEVDLGGTWEKLTMTPLDHATPRLRQPES
ncbi:hypothetical protein ACFQ05_38000 [Amycolatopsis umgeniensis]|uniref:CDP-Glycerol:Poly(Glycerophosphate) glycerophosphotransferase n=1 Tax=Amycolatopsis umgeniensis TaxID=336628 RepID=A0A841AX52_9PSEU|nr:hypothetical protein [Amycolatopsis umgeniensis]MBB5851221.1 hypothetical protein [Amycolatopsis umgeniensis]